VLSEGRHWDRMSGTPMPIPIIDIYAHLTELGIDDRGDRQEWAAMIRAADSAYRAAVSERKPG